MATFIRTLFLFLVPALPVFAAAHDPWVVDHSSSSVGFTVNHMMISEIQGRFDDFYASVDTDLEDLEKTKLSMSVSVASIDTGLDQRDDHLRSESFLDVKKHPKMKFVSGEIMHITGKLYNMQGTLTIKGVSREVTFQLVHGGSVKDFWGNQRIGFKVIGSFSRFDFGLSWNELLEAGGLIVGEEVSILATIEAFQQAGGRDLAGQE